VGLRLVDVERADAHDIRERWRKASLAAGWAFPGDWWTSSVEAVAEAVRDCRPLGPVCAELGRSRALAGVELAEVLDDLDALFTAVPMPKGMPDRSSHEVIRAAALGWADVTCSMLNDSACEDPLSRLTSPAYLRTRLGELYREASRSGSPVMVTHALVVVRAEARSGLVRLTGGLHLAESLRAVFSGGETLCAAGATHTLALVRREGNLAGRVAALRRLFDELHQRTLRVWVEGLPPSRAAAVALLDDFAR
jgi:hypothetical protein